ncbi:hypothetical protein M9H77_23158 [Catharanthus roseus]|uniref:Uncharacterized protein n=1 Tax=Catharanthus roseus TaxID=4058 RepID=A0ACC0ASH3_CATRO|nr:hypothetical protein M9H77_23158 [Catharanthus roseus]
MAVKRVLPSCLPLRPDSMNKAQNKITSTQQGSKQHKTESGTQPQFQQEQRDESQPQTKIKKHGSEPKKRNCSHQKLNKERIEGVKRVLENSMLKFEKPIRYSSPEVPRV